MKTEKLPLERFPGIRARSISERVLVVVCVSVYVMLAAVAAAQVNTEYGEVVSY